MATEESDAYVYQAMLTCIGNKRRLVPFVLKGVERVKELLKAEKLRVLDAFCGSTVVARALSAHASELFANDIEEYSYIMQQCFLEQPADETSRARIAHHIAEMNHLAKVGPQVEGVVCLNYAPRDTEAVKPGERAFYTRENAFTLDTLRAYVDSTVEPELRPWCLAPLLVEASIKTNTGGVFKGFYKDRNGVGCFGGEARNSLSRIMAPVELSAPVWNPHPPARVRCFNMDAIDLLNQLPENSLDLVYLDPPYNQHAYGSNYFMLNVLARNKAPVKVSRVSGIPTDWKRSDFNSRQKAHGAFIALVDRATRVASYVLLSYNNEGFLSEDDWRELTLYLGLHCERFEATHNAYRASRNLHKRSKTVSELLFLVSRQGSAGHKPRLETD